MTSPSTCVDLHEPKRTVIFTVCSANYLDKAIAMGLSALEHHADVDFVILVADGKREVEVEDPRYHAALRAYFSSIDL